MSSPRSDSSAILEFLVRHAGDIVTRSPLAEHIWQVDLIAIDNLIDVHMKNVRRKVDLPGFVAALMTRKAFRVIDDVVHQARRIGETNLNERLPHPGADDEIGYLVDTLNGMLDRLERAFDMQRRFAADASHELRSPLSRLRTEIEVTLRRPRDVEEYVDTLRSCMDEVQRLTLLVEELLMLARLDAGQERSAIEPVSLNALVEEIVSRMEPLAEERHIKLIAECELQVMANVAYGPARLVLTNLLDNAIKFSPPDGLVRVQVMADHENAVLRVSDQGPVVSDDEMPYLFDRRICSIASIAEQVRAPGR